MRFVLYAFACCIASSVSAADGHVETFPSPAGLAPAPDFRVEVNGEAQFVYDTPVEPFVSFAFSGQVTVRIITLPDAQLGAAHRYTVWRKTIRAQPLRGDIRELVIRPRLAGIDGKIDGGTIAFVLDKPCRLSIEINGNLTRPLFLFADAVNPDLPKPGDTNVRTFAAGKVHDAGQIQLQDNETIYIPGGAVVRGMIHGEGVHNARVLGQGILDGSDPDKVKSPLIAFRECRDILVDGPVVLNEHGWTIVPRQSERVTFRNIKLIGWSNNSDGIDISGCRDVTVDGCFLRNNDDCIPIKANRGNENHDVDGVRVLRSVFWNATGGNAIEIGFELRTKSIRNVLWRDCDIIHVEDGAAFSIHNGDWATVENIRFEDIRVEDACDELIDLSVGLSIYSDDCPSEYARSNSKRKPIPDALRAQPGTNNQSVWLRLPKEEMDARAMNRGQIKNIHFKNIHVLADCTPSSIIQGYDESRPVSGVTIEGLHMGNRPILSADEGRFRIERAENIRFLGTEAVVSD